MGALPLPSAMREQIWWSQDDVGKAGLGSGVGAGQNLLQPRKPSVPTLVAEVSHQLRATGQLGYGVVSMDRRLQGCQIQSWT